MKMDAYKRKERNVAAVLLAVFMAFLTLFGLVPAIRNGIPAIRPKAETATSYPLADDVFSFENGASLTKSDLSRLGFGLNLNDPDFETFSGNDQRTYYFTMYRMNKDGTTSTPVVQYMFYITGGTLGLMHKNLSYYSDETFFFSPDQKRGEIYTENDPGYTFTKDSFEEAGYIVDFISDVGTDEPDFVWDEAATSRLLRFAVDTNDPYTGYFVRFNYEIKIYKGTERYGFLWLKERKIYDTYTGKIDSPVRSVHEVLKNMQSAGDLESVFADYPESLAEANGIIENEATQRIRVKYLTQIGETPFATHNYAYVEVPVTEGTIPVDRVAAALNVQDFDALGCSCYGFEYDSASGVYVGKYLKNVWLSAKTTDGNSANYFLDCNLSYKDYYYQFVQDGVFSDDLYQYIFSQMLNAYPDLKGQTYDTVYGYFGYVVIPNTYSLNALWAEMFNTQTTFKGAVKTYQYTELLQYSSYQKLLDEYQYTWLEKAWNGVAGFVTGGSWSADHYLFYADVTGTEIVIGENGADDILDNSGLIWNQAGDGLANIQDGISGFFGDVGEFFADGRSVFRIVLGVVVGSLVIILIVWAINSVRDLFGGNKKKKKK